MQENFVMYRQVTDVDVTDLGFSGPRIPFCATGALWGRVTPFSRSLFQASKQLSAPKSQRFLRFAIAMPIADPRNRSDFRDKRKQCCIAI